MHMLYVCSVLRETSEIEIIASISHGRLHGHSWRQLRLNKESVLSYWLTDMVAW